MNKKDKTWMEYSFESIENRFKSYEDKFEKHKDKHIHIAKNSLFGGTLSTMGVVSLVVGVIASTACKNYLIMIPTMISFVVCLFVGLWKIIEG